MKFWSLIAVVALFPSIASASITVHYNDLYAYANDGISSDAWNYFGGLTNPNNSTPYQLDAIDGEAYSKNVAKWTQSSGQTIFTLDSTLKRTGTAGSTTYGYDSALFFSVTESTPFDFSGYINATDIGNGQSGEVRLYAHLWNSTSGNYVFNSQQTSYNTHDEQLVVGGSGGDSNNFLHPASSLAGNLIAGQQYQLVFYGYIRADGADQGASAMSNFTLKLGAPSVSAVPELSSLAIWSVLGLVSIKRRRQLV